MSSLLIPSSITVAVPLPYIFSLGTATLVLLAPPHPGDVDTFEPRCLSPSPAWYHRPCQMGLGSSYRYMRGFHVTMTREAILAKSSHLRRGFDQRFA